MVWIMVWKSDHESINHTGQGNYSSQVKMTVETMIEYGHEPRRDVAGRGHWDEGIRLVVIGILLLLNLEENPGKA